MKILIIEDDRNTADMIRLGLTSEGYIVEVAGDGSEGLFLAKSFACDLVILDYSLPKRNGIEVCQELRRTGISTPVLFLSVEDDTDMKASALDSGADDYMTKPFTFKELFARIRALTRRPREIAKQTMELGDLVIDMEKKLAYRAGSLIPLTRKEYNLLEFMVRNSGSVLSRALLIEHVWSADSNPFSNTVEAHIRNLRKKINAKHRPDLISNIPGRGYIIQSRSLKSNR